MQKNQLLTLLSLFLLVGGFIFMNTASAEQSFPEGTLIRSQKSSIYYVGVDKKLHPFLHPSVFHSWYDSLDKIEIVGESILRQYQVGEPVCVRPGTWLVKFEGIPRTYVVEPGCVIRPLRSETEAEILYGSAWLQRVVELDMLQSNFYTVRSLSSADSKAGIIDKDGDGVPLSMERQYGSSDGREDYDGDSVSDYEEIYFWLTDSTKADTDGDGKGDGVEIKNGQSPTGAQTAKQLPAKSYVLPRGSSSVPSHFSQKSLYSLSEDATSHDVDISKPTIIRAGRLMQL